MLQSPEAMASVVGESSGGLGSGCRVSEEGTSAFAIGSTLKAVLKGSGQQYACVCEAPGTHKFLLSVFPALTA
jgi:hypothetical protein